jgi:hypothetical protein
VKVPEEPETVASTLSLVEAEAPDKYWTLEIADNVVVVPL